MKCAVIVLACLTLAACSSSSGGKAETGAAAGASVASISPSASSSATASATTSQAATTTAELRAAMLTISDMPTGFTSDSKPPPLRSKDYFCNKPYNDDFVAGDSVEFDKGSFGPFFSEILKAYSSSDAARAAFTAGVAGAQSCTSYTETSDGTKIALSQLSFPKMGDASFAVQFTSTSKGTTVVGDEVYYLDGPIEVGAAVAGFAANPGLLSRLAPKAFAKAAP